MTTYRVNDASVTALGFAAAVVLLAACGDGSGEAAVRMLDAPSQTRESAVCSERTPGCACEDGEAPVSCYADPRRLDHDSLRCARGTMSCRGGRWSSCESLTEYEIHVASTGAEKTRELGERANLLITPVTQCNPCNPECFSALDRPTKGDLTADNSRDLEYDPASAGVRLRSLVDVTQRGSRQDPAVCGDGVLGGVEICDDGNTRSGDGCTLDCRLEEGFACPHPGALCHRTACGDRHPEGGEQCDDGNLHIGDGCTPFCAREPRCADGACEAVCGDGKVMPGEACDDGNTRDGDGCSSVCKLEAGFRCEATSPTPPAYIELPIVYRDFKKSHPDFEHWCCGMDTGMVATTWGADKKPVPVVGSGNPSLSSAKNFNQWYNDADTNMTYADRLRVTRQSDGTYVFDSASFFPLNDRGWAAQGEAQYGGKNFHFTSEVRFWFQYVPGQKLTFRGDDDVWVFINGKLAVDLGGVHGATPGSVTLDATTAGTFGLTPGGLYEAAVFQAERHTVESNYRLQLGGFFFGRTQCRSVCGDGIVTPDEICDDGTNGGTAGKCAKDCQSWVPEFAPTGSYSREYDANEKCNIPPERPQWAKLRWEVQTPEKTSVVLELRTAPTRAGLRSATPVKVSVPAAYPTTGSLDVASLLAAAGVQKDEPYLRVSAVLNASADHTITPVLRELSLEYRCTFAE